MTKAKLLSISVLSVLFLSSCSSANTSVPEPIDISVNNHTYEAAPPEVQSEEYDPNLFPDHLSDIENEYITADAEIIMPSEYEANTVLNTYHSVYMEWDSEKILSDLLDRKLISCTSVTDQKIYDSREKIPGTERVKYKLDDDAEIVFQSGEISYTTKKSVNTVYDQYINNKKQLSTDEIEGINSADAVNAANGILESAGLSEKVLKPEVYSIKSGDTAKADEESKPEGEEISAETNESVYLIVYPVITKGLPSSEIVTKIENEVLDCSMVYFIYSQKGIEEFKINGMIKSSAVAEEAQILSPVHAFNLLSRSYDGTHKCSITGIELVSINRIVYNSDSIEITTEPVWMLSGKYSDSDQSIVSYVSAVSGEVIPVYQIAD